VHVRKEEDQHGLGSVLSLNRSPKLQWSSKSRAAWVGETGNQCCGHTACIVNKTKQVKIHSSHAYKRLRLVPIHTPLC